MPTFRKINFVIGREVDGGSQIQIYSLNGEIAYFSTPQLAVETAEDFNRNRLDGNDDWKAYEIRLEPYRPLKS